MARISNMNSMYYNVLDILAHITMYMKKKKTQQIYDFNTTKRLYKHNHQNNNKNRRPKRTKTMCMKLVYEHESKVLYNFFIMISMFFFSAVTIALPTTAHGYQLYCSKTFDMYTSRNPAARNRPP